MILRCFLLVQMRMEYLLEYDTDEIDYGVIR